MNEQHSAGYGGWDSPIDSRMVAGAGRSARGIFSELQVDGGRIFWRELLADQDGRYSLFTLDEDGRPQDLLPRNMAARTLVHEYGGGSYTVSGRVLYFANFSDQRLYRSILGGEPRPITLEPELPRSHRYADFRVSPDRSTLASVRERHMQDGQVINELVLLDASGASVPRIAASGRDFYSNPRWSPDGSLISWLSWNHPNMPWDETELWVAGVEGGELSEPTRVAGGNSVSIFQPCWSPGAELHYASDRTGWWNIYRLRDDGELPVHSMNAEFGSPQWVFGLSHMAILSNSRIAAIAICDGSDRLVIVDPETGSLDQIDLPFTTYNPAHLRSDGQDRLWFVASSPEMRQALYMYDTRQAKLERLAIGPGPDIEAGYLSRPEAISFQTGNGEQAHAIFYPPRNDAFRAPEDDKPPLIVSVHGGPTSAAKMQYHLETQFFTSRGFALVDVNYRGSTGYGRAYRIALQSQWGIADMEDCLAAARYLAETGRIDPDRQAIRGASAGGFTVLCALTKSDLFDAGASYYGVADLAALVEHTHKFEKHYLDRLIGPYPEDLETYRERSPIYHTDKLSCPLILLHGSEDKVVPPAQAYEMAAKLEEKGIPYSLIVLEGESHGFYAEKSVVTALEAELAFYRAVFRISQPSEKTGIEIHNLSGPPTPRV